MWLLHSVPLAEVVVNTSTYYRVEALQKFEDVRFRAQICQISMRLANRPVNLLPLAPIRGRLAAINRIPRGIQEISLAQIVGSLGRAADFDRHFRPLQDRQRDRWINIWAMHKLSGWDPIVVQQIGNLYFVEDGHHRTSVARAINMIRLLIALLLPGITVIVVAGPLPEPGTVRRTELDGAHPLGAFPEVAPGYERPQGEAMRWLQVFAIVLVCQQDVVI